MSKVHEAILELQMTLEMEYMRTGLRICLEPDAFFRFSNELQQKTAMGMGSITPKQHDAKEIKLAGPGGYITIVKDESLGESSYVKTYFQE